MSFSCVPRESRNWNYFYKSWIPAFAGMTVGCYTVGMLSATRSWYRRPGVVLSLVVLLLALLWSSYFIWLTAQNLGLIKGRPDVLAKIRNRHFQASLSKAFTQRPADSVDLSRLTPRGGEPTWGNPQAKVRLIEFVDYDCPFSQQVAPALINFMRQHADDVHLTLRDFPLTEIHPTAEPVAVAANCVWSQGQPKRFWDFYTRLLAQPGDHSAAVVRFYAQQLGIDLDKFDACVAGQQPLGAIRQSLEDGVAAGVIGTPTFFFNGIKFQGALDAEAMETIFEFAKQNKSEL